MTLSDGFLDCVLLKMIAVSINRQTLPALLKHNRLIPTYKNPIFKNKF
jgi:hypothetical protein